MKPVTWLTCRHISGQVKDRQVWRSALESGNYELLCSTSRESGGMSRQTEHMDVDAPFQSRAGDRYTRVHAQNDEMD